MYIPLENHFLLAYLISKQEIFSSLCSVRTQGVLAHLLFGWMGMRVPRGWERWVRKKSHSESKPVRATVLPFGWTFSFSAYLEMLNWWHFFQVATDCHTTVQGLINFNLPLSLIRDVLGNVQEASGLSEIFVGLGCVSFPPCHLNLSGF